MNYKNIIMNDIANGVGLRTTLFVTGCEFYCDGCFNFDIWDFNKGKEFTKETIDNIIKISDNDHIRGLSILGGEPLHENNVSEVLDLILEFKMKFPNKDIWLWTGYTYEELICNNNLTLNNLYRILILLDIDVLVDGRFEKDKKDLSLRFRGSSNQRIIDVKETIKQYKIIERMDL